MLVAHSEGASLQIENKNDRFLKFIFGAKARIYVDVEKCQYKESLLPAAAESLYMQPLEMSPYKILCSDGFVVRYALKTLRPYLTKSKDANNTVVLLNIDTVGENLKLIDVITMGGDDKIICSSHEGTEYNILFASSNSSSFITFTFLDENQCVVQFRYSLGPTTKKVVIVRWDDEASKFINKIEDIDYYQNHNIKVFRPKIPAGVIISNDKMSDEFIRLLKQRFPNCITDDTIFISCDDINLARKEVLDATRLLNYSAASFVVDSMDPTNFESLLHIKNFKSNFQSINFIFSETGSVFYQKEV